MRTTVDAKDVRFRGMSPDGRAREFEWRCGRCGIRGDMVDDFLGVVRIRQCSLMACGADNRVYMGRGRE